MRIALDDLRVRSPRRVAKRFVHLGARDPVPADGTRHPVPAAARDRAERQRRLLPVVHGLAARGAVAATHAAPVHLLLRADAEVAADPLAPAIDAHVETAAAAPGAVLHLERVGVVYGVLR